MMDRLSCLWQRKRGFSQEQDLKYTSLTSLLLWYALKSHFPEAGGGAKGGRKRRQMASSLTSALARWPFHPSEA